MDIEQLARESGMYFCKDDFGPVPEVECTLDSLTQFASAIHKETLLEAARVGMHDDLLPCPFCGARGRMLEAYEALADTQGRDEKASEQNILGHWTESEEFDGVCYSYRSWPGNDPAGVMERFEELKAYIRNESPEES